MRRCEARLLNDAPSSSFNQSFDRSFPTKEREREREGNKKDDGP